MSLSHSNDSSLHYLLCIHTELVGGGSAMLFLRGGQAVVGGGTVESAARALRASAVALSKSYYDILGVPRNASQDDIKRAYKQLAKKLHPDFNKNDQNANDRFQEVQKAYDVLKDPEQRKLYDSAGHEQYERMREAGVNSYGEQQGQGTNAGFGSPFGAGAGSAGGYSPFDNIFEQMFGVDLGKGLDMRTSITLDFMEAVQGCRKQVQVPNVNTAGQRTGDTRTVTVDVPAGVDSGLQLNMEGQGGPGAQHSSGRRSASGDLLVAVQVRPHPYFERDGADVRCSVDVPLHVAALGGTVTVPTLSGEREMSVRKGTQPQQEIRIPQGGTRDLRTGEVGDLVVVMRVKVPTQLSQRQQDLFKEFAEEERRKRETVDDMFRKTYAAS